MSRKSTTCQSKQTGRPLTEYQTKPEATRAASSIGEMVAYKCRRCSLWHLSPARNHTPSSSCTYCTSSAGKPKQTYRSEDEARRRARLIKEERGVSLDVYPCPHGDGWHLTKRSSY